MKTNSKSTALIFHLLSLVFLASLVFSLRAVSSISIGIMLLAGLLTSKTAFHSIFKNRHRNTFLTGCVLYFILQLIALLYTDDLQQGWANVRIKAGMILVPIAAILILTTIERKKLLQQFCIILFLASIYCLYNSILKYIESGDISAFFYHELAKPIHQHAVYLSILTIIGIIFLLESLAKNEYLINYAFTFFLAVFLSGFLVLLSSKFVIACFLVYLATFFVNLLKGSQLKRLVIAAVFIIFLASLVLVISTKNPVRERFADIFKGDLSLVTRDKFDQGIYFNGLQFRLLQWRFVAEILTEKRRWWLGVGPGDAQTILNEKFVAKNMYSGDPARGDRGYLAYNTHNQFLETILQTGIAGLLPVLLICFSLIRMMISNRQPLAVFTVCLLLGWLLIEAAFETQYGIMIFTFFSLFLNNHSRQVFQQHTLRPTL